jgi:hypothetical protein
LNSAPSGRPQRSTTNSWIALTTCWLLEALNHAVSGAANALPALHDTALRRVELHHNLLRASIGRNLNRFMGCEAQRDDATL